MTSIHSNVPSIVLAMSVIVDSNHSLQYIPFQKISLKVPVIEIVLLSHHEYNEKLIEEEFAVTKLSNMNFAIANYPNEKLVIIKLFLNSSVTFPRIVMLLGQLT